MIVSGQFLQPQDYVLLVFHLHGGGGGGGGGLQPDVEFDPVADPVDPVEDPELALLVELLTVDPAPVEPVPAAPLDPPVADACFVKFENPFAINTSATLMPSA